MNQCQVFTPAEIASFRNAGRILRGCLEHTAAAARPGITTLELDALAEAFIRAHAGAEPAFLGYHGYRHTLCTSVNEEVVHGVPGNRVLAEGDIVSIDCGVTVDGLCTDACVTVPVGVIDEESERLLRVTAAALDAAVRAIRGGCTTGDIGAAVQRCVEAGGCTVVRALTGHGLGRTLHQYPDIPNFGRPGAGAVLPAGTVVAVEPIVTLGEHDDIVTGRDGWTLSMKDGSRSAHCEHTVLVTERGCDVLA